MARRILLIDDDAGIRQFIAATAERDGFQIHATDQPEDFREQFKALRPHAIILDLSMPEVDGVALLRWLAEEGCRSLIMIISGSDRRIVESAGRFAEARRLRLLGALQKPIRLAVLREFFEQMAAEPDNQ